MHAAFQNLAQRHRRIATALWFILAAAILPGAAAMVMSAPARGTPSLSDVMNMYYLLTNQLAFAMIFVSRGLKGEEYRWLLFLSPLISAALGHRIITMTDTKASGRGMLVAACALLLFAAFFSVLISEKGTTDRDSDVAGALITVLPMLIVPVMVAGGGAGWLLYRLTRDATAERQAMDPP